MGWNTWNKYGCDIDAGLIMETTDTMKGLGLMFLGYHYIIIDDCWQATQRDADGSILADPIKFPSGMASVSKYVHSAGFLFGIYSSAGSMTC